MLISSSQVHILARASGVPTMEVTDGGCTVGIKIGERVVRHNGVGWYDALKVQEAIGPENIPVSLTGLPNL